MKVLMGEIRFPGIALLLLTPGTVLFTVYAAIMAFAIGGIGFVFVAILLVAASILCWGGIKRLKNPSDQSFPILTRVSIVIGVVSTLSTILLILELGLGWSY